MAQWDNLSARTGIYRNTECGWIAGVCAGIADRVSINVLWIRLLFVLAATMFHGMLSVVAYFALAFLLKPRAGVFAAASPAGSERVASSFVSPPPPVQNLQSRFADLERRLNNLEAAVTSDDLSLRRKFRDLGA